MADFANIAAATAAGYKEVVTLRGGTYSVLLEKFLAGSANAPAINMQARGEGVNQAAAEAQALASLNAQRRDRYARTSSVPKTSGLGTYVANDRSTRTLDACATTAWLGSGQPAAGCETVTPDAS